MQHVKRFGRIALLVVYCAGIAGGIVGIGVRINETYNDTQESKPIIIDYVVSDRSEDVLGVDYGDAIVYEPAYVLGDVEELHIEATAYCYGTTTCTGKPVREGIAAMAKGYLGKTAIVYEDMDGVPGDLIGIYEVEDTGGDYRIQEGRCIDIYIPDYDKAIEFGRQDVIVFLVNAKG